jgi:hypothetical protein
MLILLITLSTVWCQAGDPTLIHSIEKTLAQIQDELNEIRIPVDRNQGQLNVNGNRVLFSYSIDGGKADPAEPTMKDFIDLISVLSKAASKQPLFSDIMNFGSSVDPSSDTQVDQIIKLYYAALNEFGEDDIQNGLIKVKDLSKSLGELGPIGELYKPIIDKIKSLIKLVNNPGDGNHLKIKPGYTHVIKIEPTPFFYELGEDVRKTWAYGTINVHVVYDRYFKLDGAPGIVFSAVDKTHYGLEPVAALDDQGKPILKYKIVEDEKDFREFNVGYMLRVLPNQFKQRGEQFQYYYCFGASANDKYVGLLSGIGFNFFDDKVNISLGPIYQQIQTLKGGLSPGQELASNKEFALEKKFELGVFFAVSTKIQKK